MRSIQAGEGAEGRGFRTAAAAATIVVQMIQGGKTWTL